MEEGYIYPFPGGKDHAEYYQGWAGLSIHIYNTGLVVARILTTNLLKDMKVLLRLIIHIQFLSTLFTINDIYHEVVRVNAKTILLNLSIYSELGMVVEGRSRGKHFPKLSRGPEGLAVDREVQLNTSKRNVLELGKI